MTEDGYFYDILFHHIPNQTEPLVIKHIPEGWLRLPSLIATSKQVDFLTLKEILQATNHFNVPLFQRTYWY